MRLPIRDYPTGRSQLLGASTVSCCDVFGALSSSNPHGPRRPCPARVRQLLRTVECAKRPPPPPLAITDRASPLCRAGREAPSPGRRAHHQHSRALPGYRHLSVDERDRYGPSERYGRSFRCRSRQRAPPRPARIPLAPRTELRTNRSGRLHSVPRGLRAAAMASAP